MDSKRHTRHAAWIGTLAVATALALGWPARAQDSGGKPKGMFIEANAQGTSTQMGRIGTVQFIIESYSTDEERQTLIQAFQASGSQGLYDAVSKMKARGRIKLPGTLGYDINYVKVFQTPTGRKIRMVTDRPIAMGEARNSTRSMDYNLSLVEIDLPNGGKGTGVLIPAAQLELNSDKELSVEAYQNPWKLSAVRER
jgi:hypothetical protein